MRFFKLGLIAIVTVLLTVPTAVLADTYQVYLLGIANPNTVYGIDSSGVAVTVNNGTGIYSSFDKGLFIGSSFTPPTLTYDNGTPCSPTLSPGVTQVPNSKSSCNNGHEVFGGEYLGLAIGVYTGPNSTDFLQGGSVDALALNAFGDFAWVDGVHEQIFEAVDQTTHIPEPNSMMFLGTGVLAAAGVVRRRFCR